jgi:hypothetical protein
MNSVEEERIKKECFVVFYLGKASRIKSKIYLLSMAILQAQTTRSGLKNNINCCIFFT